MTLPPIPPPPSLNDTDRRWVADLVDEKVKIAVKDRLDSALGVVFERTRVMDATVRYSEQSMGKAASDLRAMMTRFEDLSKGIAERYGVLQATTEDHSQELKVIQTDIRTLESESRSGSQQLTAIQTEIQSVQRAIYGDTTHTDGPPSIWRTVNTLSEGQSQMMDRLEHIQAALREQAQQRSMWRKAGNTVWTFLTSDLAKKLLIVLASGGGLGAIAARILEILGGST